MELNPESNRHRQLEAYLKSHPCKTGKVVDFNADTDCLLPFNFTAANTRLSAEVVANTALFSAWINSELAYSGCRYGIGGYMEHRTLYARSTHFNTDGEPRRLHLGTDIWGPAGTPVYAPLEGQVHSFQNNNHFGDYGPTIILQHNLDGLILYSLYGHLTSDSLTGLHAEMLVTKGQRIGAFGQAAENGGWPPHLHFQLVFNLQGHSGDYPGVCRYSEKESYLQNIPNPELVLQFNTATIR
ncbi:peptidoglycan DD-metalloendopeptidase family protein [Mucilaginibacter sp.]